MDRSTRSLIPGSLGSRLWFLGALVALEAGLLVSRFSARPLRGSQDRWELLAYQAYYLSFLAIAATAAVIAFGRPALKQALVGLGPSAARTRRWWVHLVPHLLCLAAVWQLTAFIFEGGFGDSPHRPVALVAWLGAGAGTIVFWLLCVIPAGELRRLFDAMPGIVWVTVGVGLLAGAMGFVVRTFLWEPLGSWTLLVAQGFASLFTDEIWTHHSDFIIGSPNYVVHIVPECSGYEGVGLIWVFMAAYLWFFRARLRFPHAFLLVLVATVVVWIANAARIAGLVAVGNWISGDIASGGFHSKAGWFLFCGVALGTVAVADRAAFFTRKLPADTAGRINSGTVAYLCPLLMMVTVGLATGLFSASDFDRLYPLAIVATGGVVLLCWRRYEGALRPTWSWLAPGVGLAVAGLWLTLDASAERAEVTRVGLAALSEAHRALWWASRVIGYVVLVPVVEELAFRGYLTRRLMSADFSAVPMGTFSWSSFLISSLVFGLLHDPVAGTLAGMAFALVLYRRQRLSDAIIAHAVANGALLVYALTTDSMGVLG